MPMNEFADATTRQRAKWPAVLALVTAWLWTILAAGGGALLLFERGPWPLTNGWFALASGIAACPLTAWLAKRLLGLAISGRTRFTVAALIWLSGQIARHIGL